jgi:hypothetical protein
MISIYKCTLDMKSYVSYWLGTDGVSLLQRKSTQNNSEETS